MDPIIKKPSAWIPVAMSFAMLAFIIIYIAIYGISTPNPNADEGVAAHLFQLWLFLEFLMVTFFAIKWLPRNPKPALRVLALQIVAVLAACAPIFFLGG